MGAAVLSAIATAVALVYPGLRIASSRQGPQVALETAASLIALLAGYLALSRLKRRGRLTDLVLACGLGVVGVSNAFYSVLLVFGNFAGVSVSAWSAATSRPVSVILFSAAAFVPDRQIRSLGRTYGNAAVCVVGILALAFLFTALFATDLPVEVAAASAGAPHAPSVLQPAPALLILELLTATAGGAAVFRYLSRCRRLDDDFFGWLAIAAVFATASQVSYIVHPSAYASLISVGDGFRLCFYVVLLLGSMREIHSYWLTLSESMVSTERRRIARDLHDGLAQELAYLMRNLESLDGEVEHDTLSRLRGAAKRARQESQLAISNLAVCDRSVAGDAIADAAGETAKRFGVELKGDIPPDVRLPPMQLDALLRIACEAVTNAACHSGTKQVSLSLRCYGSRVRLQVSDSGCGFDPACRAVGFGLISMRERAISAGGAVTISSAPGYGTTVEAVL